MIHGVGELYMARKLQSSDALGFAMMRRRQVLLIKALTSGNGKWGATELLNGCLRCRDMRCLRSRHTSPPPQALPGSVYWFHGKIVGVLVVIPLQKHSGDYCL